MVDQMRAAQGRTVPQPWDLTPDGHLRIRGPLATVEFRPEGLTLQNDGVERILGWETIISLSLAIPTHRLWVRSVLVAASVFGDGYTAEPRNMWIYYTDGKRRRIDLGRPDNAPFARRVLSSTREVLAVLSEKIWATGTNRLHLLADPALGPAIITEASNSYRRWDYFSMKGTRSVIDRLAPKSAR